jgi:exodeoxyribonuclease V gamma subunit
MLRVVYSNSTAALLAALARDVAAARSESALLAPTHLVVPDRHVAAWVKLGLARLSGLCANVEVHYLKRLFGDLVAGAAPDVRVVDAETRQGLVLAVLLDDDLMAAPELEPARAYVEAVAEPFARDLRRYQLAERLAHLFEEYELSRPELLDGWLRTAGRGARGRAAAAGGPEAWQRRVWLRACGPDGLLARGTAPGTRRITLRDLLGDEPAVRLEALELPPHLHLFGFSYLATTFIRLLERVARATEVHVYAPHPCAEAAVDLDPARLGGVALDGADPFDLLGESHAAAAGLRLWGRPGREHLRLLVALGGGRVEAAPGSAGPAAARTLLQRLQDDLGARRAPTGPAAPDGSIAIYRCPSVRREAEIVASEIWRLVAADPTLRFNEVAVVVAAAADERYLPHLQAALRECHGIPHSLADLTLAGESRVVDAVELLLRLPFGTYTRPELLRLVTHPAVMRAAAPDADPAQWLAWCEALGVVHGADHGDHAGTYIARDILNWDQGMRRLALGAFMTGARSGETRAFALDDERYLVEEVPDARPAAQLGLLVRSLVADSRRVKGAHLPLAEWARLLAGLVSTYVAACSPDEEADRLACVRRLEGLAAIELGTRPVSYRIAFEAARAAVTSLGGTRGRAFADGVVVSTLHPMRAVPFRVVFVVGLQEGSFPAGDARDYLDLRARGRRAGDVSPRERDKYLFLETLLAARERIGFSYVDRDLVSGTARQPSAVLVELLHLLGSGYLDPDGLRALEVRHPLRRYDERYFGPLYSPAAAPGGAVAPAALPPPLLPEARAEAQARALALHLRAHAAAGLPVDREARLALLEPAARALVRRRLGLLAPPDPPPPPPAAPAAPPATAGRGALPLRLSLATLRRFLECPLQGHAGFILGLEEDEEDVLAVEDEPFATSFPVEVGFLRRVLAEALVSGLDPRAHHDEQARLQELRGAAPTGLLGELERARQWERIATWLGQLAPGGGAPPAARVVAFGGAAEHAVVQEVAPPVVLDLELDDAVWPARLRVEVVGTTAPLADDGATSLLFTARGYPKQDLEVARTYKDLLRGFLDHVVLSASGGDAAHRARVCVGEPGAGAPLEYAFAPLAADAARAWLRRVVTSLLTRDHGYLLPCEAAFLHRLSRAGDRPRSVAAALAEVQRPRHGRVAYSSTYGPVGLLERYAPPPEAEAEAMIEERFGVFFATLVAPPAPAAPAGPAAAAPAAPAGPAAAPRPAAAPQPAATGKPAKPRRGRRP